MEFSSEGSRDPDGEPLTYSWDFDGDGAGDSTDANPTHVYTQPGNHSARLTVTDLSGKTASSTELITVGNTRPTVEIEFPENGLIFDFGDRVPYKVGVTDPEDGAIDCNRVVVHTALAHNEHAHGDQSSTGCEGSFMIPVAWEGESQFIFYVLNISYVDGGGAGGAAPLTGTAETILQPTIRQAEHFTTSSGVAVPDSSDPAGGGGRAIGQARARRPRRVCAHQPRGHRPARPAGRSGRLRRDDRGSHRFARGPPRRLGQRPRRGRPPAMDDDIDAGHRPGRRAQAVPRVQQPARAAEPGTARQHLQRELHRVRRQGGTRRLTLVVWPDYYCAARCTKVGRRVEKAMHTRNRGLKALAAITGAAAVSAAAAGVAVAADTSAPVVAPATFSVPPDGNNNWRLTKPQTLTLSATDDVAVAKFQYSLDGGVTYVDVAVTQGPAATADVSLSQEGNTTVRYRAVDSSGNFSRGATTNTTLNQPSAAGATALRLTSTTGRSAGDELVIDAGGIQETATIETIVTPAPASPAPNVTLTAPLANAHGSGALVAGTASYSTIALLIDTKGPLATWATQATTLQATSATAGAPAAAPGDTQVRLASLTGRAAGDTLQIDQGSNAETVKIASVVDPPPAAPAANVVLTNALEKSHLVGAAVYLPSIVGGKILQSQTLTPLRTDPRLRDPSDTVANGAGGAAPRRMTLDGEFMIPRALQLNRLTVGKHTQTVALQDVAGQAAKYTNRFVVTTSFADLATVIGQYADNALRSTQNGATAVGATGIRIAVPYGFRAGQEIVIDSGDNQETATIAKALSPPPTQNTTLTAPAAAGATEVRIASYNANVTGPNAPTVNGPIVGQPIVLDTGANQEVVSVVRHITPLPAAPAPNVVLNAPLAKDHAMGTATSLVNVILSAPLTKAHATGVAIANPRPLISADEAAELRTLLTDAEAKAAAGDKSGAIRSLKRFNSAADDISRHGHHHGDDDEDEDKTVERALESAGEALIDQLRGEEVSTRRTGVTVGPVDEGDQAIRSFWNPTPFAANPDAKYKVLVNGRSGGFRHQSIVDMEAMIQKLGAENDFDVEIWDPNINQGPGRQAPAGVSLTTNPFLDLETLKQYKTLVFDSTVGLNAAGLNATEFANLQAYIRGGGGFIAIHGATDSMQNVPWYMDLVGAGFTNHGGNAGGILIDTESGGHVEYITADRSHTTTRRMPDRWYSVEELYNTNRNPAELGIVHPLLWENEDTLVGQLGYNTGALMNSDEHAMVWCRNFEGGRSFTTTLGHSWQYASERWYQSMMLNAIQWTAGQEYANCVTFHEVSELLASSVAAGNVNSDGNRVLSSLLADAKAEFDAKDYDRAASVLKQFVAQTEKSANCRSGPSCPDGGAALEELEAKGKELIAWSKGLD